jgi:hypothetical protein
MGYRGMCIELFLPFNQSFSIMEYFVSDVLALLGF